MPTLDFKGKQHVYAHHLTVPYRPLVADPSRSVHPVDADDNLIIRGDNLHALKALLPRYAGRIKCVCIDPPYNTGNESWIYSDSVNSALMRSWLQDNREVDGEDMERHDKWLCMLWPRLHLLRDLLSEEGAIFVSIDDNEQHHLRMMMDEIFGENNFFALLTRRAMHTVRNSSKDFNLNADYVLAYAKNKQWWSAKKERYIRQIRDKSSSYPHDDDDGRGPYKLDPIHARNYYTPYTYRFSNGMEWSAPSGSHPRYSKKTLASLDRKNEIVFSGREPKAKRYLSQVQEGQPPDAILLPEFVGYNKDGTGQLRKIFGKGGVFPQPKPVQLVKFLLEILRSPDAIILDSFAGSGTTAHAVLSLNQDDGGRRRFILVECEDYADSVTAERVRRVIAGVPDAKDQSLRDGLPGSFTYCTLGEPVDAETMLGGSSLPDWSTLAAWLLHTASGVSAGDERLAAANEDGLFRTVGDTDYYLLYQPDCEYLRSGGAMLDGARSRRIAEVNRENRRNAVVFGPGKYVTQGELTKMNITFCQLPYELHRA